MDQRNEPLIEALQKRASEHPVSFHVPGHKHGRLFSDEGHDVLREAAKWDQTEVQGLDDLYSASGVIQEAQVLLGALYQSGYSRFLTGGSTVGNLAMLYLASKRGTKVLIQDNSHQSVYHGLALFQLEGIVMRTDREAFTGLPLGVSYKTLHKTLEAHPDAAMVLLTSPSYEGYAQSLGDHLALSKSFGLLTGVDEAHGAHFLHPSFPNTALHDGADLVVQSAHKMLPALTMGAWLHVGQEAPLPEEEVQQALNMLQTSSPSYLIMASLDAARAVLARLMEDPLNGEKTKLQTLLACLSQETAACVMPARLGTYVRDRIKLPLVARKPGMTHRWKERMERAHAYPELHSARHLLLTLPLSGGERDIEKLQTHAKAWFGEAEGASNDVSFAVKSPDAAWYKADTQGGDHEGERARIPLSDAVGMKSAETVTPYPPGIPLIQRGQRITKTEIDAVIGADQAGVRFQTGNRWKYEGIDVYIQKQGDDSNETT
ncbi:aminotransferase class I/II-fold pyridoxal phosphate-dependent enzyme [Salisediminibacterium selenitireducens]|uniref:Orn/Lys/Arg decarboxylase major region n=1 Tax=Bacillus selenitireducens (strain ATCC 700615 / DSM 15326 / MLS10) TaxID=439292 RepID=D6XV26_BACIE|nr:Orn/Lys/Arg decarboxylase major region [Salisediminibacterium selenitireducens]ADH97584.1 Orn/Lys/Arg decarboxylase major region [[Bacillus] selenitireducens MLS10]